VTRAGDLFGFEVPDLGGGDHDLMLTADGKLIETEDVSVHVVRSADLSLRISAAADL
jgi:hypothetical protein